MTEHALQRLAERAPFYPPLLVLRVFERWAEEDQVVPFARTVTGDRIYQYQLAGRPPIYGVAAQDAAIKTILEGGMEYVDHTGRVQRLPADVLWLGPGKYDLDAETYHRDPCETPALSASLAHTFYTATPYHAWWDSWRLNPDYQPTDTEAFDVGRACHEIMTGKGRGFEVLPYKDFKTKKAQEERDECRAQGLTPLTQTQMQKINVMMRAAHMQIDLYDLPGGSPFKSEDVEREVAIVWRQGGVLNRIMIDALDVKRRIAWDYKTCAGLAEPETWVRGSMNHGADMRAAHYLDGLEAHFGGTWRYIFVPQEKDPPHCLSVLELSEGAITMARRKMETVREGWRWCLDTGVWPSYPRAIVTVDPPAFWESKQLERESRELDTKARLGKDLIELGLRIQAPAGHPLSLGARQ